MSPALTSARRTNQRRAFKPSEIESESKLKTSHERVWRQAENLTSGAAINATVRITQVYVIEDVERLCSKLPAESFGNDKALRERNIGVEPTWSKQRVASSIADCAGGRPSPRSTRITVVCQHGVCALIPVFWF